MERKKGKNVAVSWSGGKDSCLALYRVLQQNDNVVCLVSMVSEKDDRNHAHGVRLDILRLQAAALGLPLILVDSAGEYELSLKRALYLIKEEYGVESIVFGSLYSKEDREWNEKVSYQSGLQPLFPVWISQNHSSNLLHEFISLGFQSIVCRASTKVFDSTWPGRLLDWDFYNEIHQTESCVMGEAGEYHTFVLDGPIFQKKIAITQSTVVLNSGLWSLDIQSCRLLDHT
ncbi:diphthine--ammonia ligase [Bacillus spongiae]|uniref:Diphthine--ammonia ligase n=1 Tax=Bacillus spongiae TaxID=2683610 RepID=A0ABU8HDG5_9BACI